MARVAGFFESLFEFESFILFACIEIVLFGAVFPVHIAKFIEGEYLSILSDATIAINRGSRSVFELDAEIYHEHYRG